MADPIQTKIDLNIEIISEDEALPGFGACLVRITAANNEHIAKEIFVYQKDVVGEFSANQDDFFFSVASVFLLETLPADAGTLDEPFFRLSTLEQVFQRKDKADEFITSIKAQVLALVKANDTYVNESSHEEMSIRVTSSGIEEIEE